MTMENVWIIRSISMIILLMTIGLTEQSRSQNQNIKQQTEEKVSIFKNITGEKRTYGDANNSIIENNCSSEVLCSCIRLKEGKLKAQCSELRLTFIPEFRDDVIEIDLSNNFIENFPVNSKFPKKLVKLYLSKNLLRAFNNNPFRDLNQLATLDLSGNQFGYNTRTFKNGIFEDLIHLKCLNLKGNNNNISVRYYPPEISKLQNLQELHLDGLKDATFPECYAVLIFLKVLNFSGLQYNKCGIRQITETFLNHVPGIERLSLSVCDLRDIDKGALRLLSNMTTLDISNNNYLSFKILRNLTFGLQFTNIKHLNLTYLHCPAGVGSMILPNDIAFLSNTSLEELYLPFNRLEVIGEGVMKHLPTSLRIFDVSFNHVILIAIADLLNLFQKPNLEVINVCCQGHHTHHTRVGSLVNCHDWRGPHEQKGTYSSVIANHTYRALSLPVSTSDRRVLHIPVSKSLKEIHLDGTGINQHVDTIYIVIFSKNNNIQNISLQNNKISKLNFVLKNVQNLQSLNIGDNGATTIVENYYHHMPSLTCLNIEKNSLGQILSRDINGTFFKYLNNLTHLIMNNNGLGNVPVKLFHGLPKLRVLNANFNALSEWNADIDHMPQLKLLDLSTNRIKALNQKTMNAIVVISKTSNIKVDLHNNTLQCNCRTLTFLKWFNRNRKLFKAFETNTCFKDNLSIVYFRDIDATIQELQRNCSSFFGVTIGVLVCICITVLVTCGAIIYRYRWNLRYMYFIAKKGHRQTSEANETQFEFDAFISYANEDECFVTEELTKRLEDHYRLKLILHDRDFLPGKPIDENITDSIKNSRKTVVILSRNYLQSYWCMYELNMARMEHFYSRGDKRTIFIVLLESLKTRDLPHQLMDIIDTDSYIRVPQVRNDEFWENFYKGLSMG